MIRYNCTSCQWTGAKGDTFDGMCPMCCKPTELADSSAVPCAIETFGDSLIADQRGTTEEKGEKNEELH